MTPVRRARDDDPGRQTNKVTHHTSTTCHFHQPDSAPTLDTNDALHHRDHASSHRINTTTLHHRAEPTATRELRLQAHTQHSHSHKRQDRTETDPTPSAWQKASSHTAQSQTARRNDKVIQVLEFAFATSEQQSKIEKKRGYGYKQQDGGNTTKNTKTRACEQQKTLLIQQGLSRRRRPQVWLLWKKKQKEKRKETFLAPFFPFGSSHHLHLFTSGYHPNADYPPRCPTQVTHHPLRFIPFHRPSLPPSLPNTKSYSCPSRPFKSEHSSSRAQNAPLPHAAQWAPSHAHFPLAVPVVTKCCCCCIFLLSPVCVCVACVLCSRPSPPECRRKKKKKEEKRKRYYEK